MKKFKSKYSVVFKNINGVVSATNVHDLKRKQGEARRKKIDSNPTEKNLEINDQTEDFAIEEHQFHQFSSVTLNVTLPFPTSKTMILSGSIDDTQICITEKNSTEIFGVVIKKVPFKDGERFISGCSACSSHNSDFVIYLENSLLFNKCEASALIKCEHIAESVAKILQNFNKWEQGVSEDKIQSFLMQHCTWKNNSLFFFNENFEHICLAFNSIEGILPFVLKNGKWRCVYDKMIISRKCRHGKYVEIDENSSRMFHKEIKFEPFPIIGKTKIDVDELKTLFVKRAWNLENFFKDNFNLDEDTGFLKIVPEKTKCDACNEDLVLTVTTNGVIIGPGLVNCIFYTGKCCNDDCTEDQTVSFSGISKGMVNFDNKFLIFIDVVIEYFELYSTNGLKFTTWIKTKTQSFNFKSNEPLFKEVVNISNYFGILHEAFCATSELLKLNKSPFLCCPLGPKGVIVDATCNSISNSRMPTFNEAWINTTKTQRASTRKDRQLEPLNEHDKKMITKIFSTNSCSKSELQYMRNHHHLGIETLSYCINKEDGIYCLQKPAKLFCTVLIKTVAAASSIIPASCVDIFKSINENWIITMDDLLKLKAESPTLHGLYSTINKLHARNEIAQMAFKKLVSEFLDKRSKTFSESYENFEEISQENFESTIKNMGNVDCSSSLETLELLNTGVFFPGHRIYRKMDRVNIKKNEELQNCNKTYKQPGPLAPGVLYFYCLEHETCIGFVILKKAESLELICELIMTRFMNIPSTIIYDNACNLHEFVINRYPKPFEKTSFYVDGFHYNSHVNCAASYNAADHMCITKKLNSSLVEQKNSQLRYLKQTSPYLKFTTFANKLVYSTYYINNK